jgi:hypothetical protein
MAKRSTGVGNQKKSNSHKTAKRLEIKRQMLLLKNSKHRKHNRTISSGKLKPKKIASSN